MPRLPSPGLSSASLSIADRVVVFESETSRWYHRHIELTAFVRLVEFALELQVSQLGIRQ